jgi:S-adenosyl-L-methionine hydrolase (adenosine-forming)
VEERSLADGATETAPWRASGVVSLLTDFGTVDPYVGVVKGVLRRHFPEIDIIDLTHGVPAGNVTVAGWHLKSTFGYFPKGTVHVSVVDPGVGSSRRILLAVDRGHAFLAPDNGLLGPVLSQKAEVRALDVPRFRLSGAGSTFDGRDVFAPAAAILAAGALPSEAGELVSDWHRGEFPAARENGDGSWSTEVLFADRFGNLITPLDARYLSEEGDWVAEIGGEVLPLVRTYSDVSSGEGLALVGSSGSLEISVRDGDAAAKLGGEAGTVVRVRRRE